MNIFLRIAIGIALYMTFWFVLAVVRKRNDVADMAWGLGFVLIAASCFWTRHEHILPAIFVVLMVVFWGIRLAVHIGWRHVGGTREDSRYAKWRADWGRFFLVRTYFQVFLLQGLFMFLIALPVIFATEASGVSLSATGQSWAAFFVALGVAVWVVGFLFEFKADNALAHFVRNPENAGKVLRSGLWKYSRHPNYFGEVTMWWGIWITILPYVAAAGAWWTVIGPVTITFLITQVSGIPLLEKGYEGNAEYDAYKRQTSAFFPLPPRRTTGR